MSVYIITVLALCVLVGLIVGWPYLAKEKTETKFVVLPHGVYVSETTPTAVVRVTSQMLTKKYGKVINTKAIRPVTRLLFDDNTVSVTLQKETTDGIFTYLVEYKSGDGFDLNAIEFVQPNGNGFNQTSVNVHYRKTETVPQVTFSIEEITHGESDRQWGIKMVVPEDMPDKDWQVNGQYSVLERFETGETEKIYGKFIVNGFGRDMTKVNVGGICDLTFDGVDMFWSKSKELIGKLDRRGTKITFGDTVVI